LFYIGVAKVDRDVAKVDQDVAHVAITMHACFIYIYVPNVSYVSDVCCKCFYLDVAKVDLDAAYIASVCFKCFLRTHFVPK
jgi:hypothetical protein